MRFSELSNLLRLWMSRQIRIDAWSSDPPRTLTTVIENKAYPSTVAFQAPVKDLFVPKINSAVSIGQRVISLVMPFAVQYRFSSRLQYNELPLTQITALYMSVTTEWLINGAVLDDDILSVAITDIVESPIVVSRIDDVSSDWLVTTFFELQVETIFDSEPVPDLQPGDVEIPLPDSMTVQVGIWRSKSDTLGNPQQSFLDS
ncbi:MAG: hypothetical protein KME18_07885 [Phormidium tanganyikae FI6-MK23]|nr:hypothetical protein [Phormidium tanganyikae FI6-MK23]